MYNEIKEEPNFIINTEYYCFGKGKGYNDGDKYGIMNSYCYVYATGDGDGCGLINGNGFGGGIGNGSGDGDGDG